MAAMKESQFTLRYNKIMFITFVVVISISIALASIQVHNRVEQESIQRLEEFKNRSIALDNLIVNITSHLNMMQAKAESFLWEDTHSLGLSNLFHALSDKGDGLYSLDNIPSPYSEEQLGNLTGTGSTQDFSFLIKAELEMALDLNSLFAATKKNIPNSAWIYYTSKNNFINIYPWVPSDKFQFSQELYTHEFYFWGLPESNPERKIIWTPAYVDEYGEGLMVTAAKPIYREDVFLGTVAIDVTLDRLTEYVQDFRDIGGTLMIINEQNQLIAHPELALSEENAIYTLQDALPASFCSEPETLFQEQPLKLFTRNSHVYTWYRMDNAPWRIVFISKKENKIIKIFSMIGIGFFVLLLALTALLFGTKRITFQEFIYPAERLVYHIAQESENASPTLPDVPAPWIPWFTEVTNIFLENRKLIQEIIATTAARERIESELNVAREIQMGTLPTEFTFEPEHKELDVYAYLLPAQEVGGDLYDFFFVDEEHLCFTLGDVAGKGVPAALFMVITKELISNNVLLGNLSPADVMTWINKMLYRGNPSAMFVTLVIGILNVTTGEVHYANGGHVPPIFVGCEDGLCYKKELSGPVVGAIPGISYKDISVTLQPGEAFFLCSDGVTEAMNEEDELFSDARLLEDFARIKENSSKEVVEGILSEVKIHAGNAPQSDDIAMLMIRWNPESRDQET